VSSERMKWLDCVGNNGVSGESSDELGRQQFVVGVFGDSGKIVTIKRIILG